MAIGVDGKIDNECDISKSTEDLLKLSTDNRMNDNARINALSELVKRLINNGNRGC